MSTTPHYHHFPDENDCGPPTILNGIYNKDPTGWYEEGDVIRVTCDPGREHLNRVATAKCINGTWSSIPVCVSKCAACHKCPPGGLVQVSEPACSQEVQRRAYSPPRSLMALSLASRTKTCLRWIQVSSTSVKTDTLSRERPVETKSSASPETGPKSQNAVSGIRKEINYRSI